MRFISLLLAFAVASVVTLYPRAIATDMTNVPHMWLVLLLTGMSLNFIYGLGFRTNHRWINFFLSPLLAWPLTCSGAFMIWKIGPLGHA